MKRTLLAASILALAGCTAGPDYRRPEVETPAAYREAGHWQQAQPRDAAERGRWWAAFGDPQLDELMKQVEVSNQTIAAAEAQVRVSAALAGQARASWWPTLAGTVSRTESRPSQRSGSFESTSDSRRTLNSLSFNATWEADLWGRIRRLVEAGDASTRASAADLLNARLSAQAELAQSYFQLRALDSQKRLLEETAAAFEKTLELTRNRHAQGVVSRADVAQAETQLASTRAQALDTGVARAQLEHAIAVLLGRAPPAFTLARGELAAAPPPVPGAGVPADLLERRPDIAAAERRVEAANAQIGVARAAFFPTATIGASFGYQAASSAVWFTSPARFWSLGPALALTLFDAGRRRALTEQRMAEYDQTVAQYRNTVFIAWREVEDNLAALRILEEEAAVLDEAARAAQQSLDIALNQYKAGIATYLQVVTAQAALLSSQRSALDLRSRRIVASVLLVRALGGGWQRSYTPGASHPRGRNHAAAHRRRFDPVRPRSCAPAPGRTAISSSRSTRGRGRMNGKLPKCQGAEATWTNCVGEVTRPSGLRFAGEFRDGKPSQGTALFPNGDKYVGEFRDGTPHGKGEMWWTTPDGRMRYVGSWSEGERHGRGTLYRADGTILASGTWRKNQFVG